MIKSQLVGEGENGCSFVSLENFVNFVQILGQNSYVLFP